MGGQRKKESNISRNRRVGPVSRGGRWVSVGGKKQGGEIQNKINTHKSKVIHGHWHQDGEGTVSQKSSTRDAGWVPVG